MVQWQNFHRREDLSWNQWGDPPILVGNSMGKGPETGKPERAVVAVVEGPEVAGPEICYCARLRSCCGSCSSLKIFCSSSYWPSVLFGYI